MVKQVWRDEQCTVTAPITGLSWEALKNFDVNWADIPKTIGDMTALDKCHLYPSIDLNVKDKNGLSIESIL